jgi:sugar/nucleoside kinase (ribokinase family)
VALDSVKTPFGEVSEALGGSASYFGASARFFSPVTLVAVVGHDFPKKHLTMFEGLGIDTRGIQIDRGKTFRWSGVYDFDLNNAKTLKTELNVFQTFKPKISDSFARASTVFLANIDPDIQRAVLRQMHSPELRACDTMNYWIEQKRSSLVRLLGSVDIFLCNEAEARELSGEFSLIGASRWILSRGPKIAVIKKGEHGVLCFSKKFLFSSPAFLLEKVFDPTGAGDSFAGGFLGALTRADRVNETAIRRAVVYGSVMASYNVESFSLDRLRRLRREEIEKRYRQFRILTKF